MTKKDENRFEQLISTVRPASSPSDTPPSQPLQSKSADPNYIRTTVYLPKFLHKLLKIAAIEEEREMSAIVEELVGNWLNARETRQ